MARRDLLEHYRDYLRRMVAARLDRRLAPRIDASDVVQETLADAAHRLDEYLSDPPLPFFGWLRVLAGEHVREGAPQAPFRQGTQRRPREPDARAQRSLDAQPGPPAREQRHEPEQQFDA